MVGPAAAADLVVAAFGRSLGIDLGFGGVTAEVVVDPLPGVAVHVVQAECIGFFCADWNSAARAVAAPNHVAVHRLAEFALVAAFEGVAEAIAGLGASAGGVFPLGFGGKAEDSVVGQIPFLFVVVDCFEESVWACDVVPADARHRLVWRDFAWCAFFGWHGLHHREPLRLGDFVGAEVEGAADGDVVSDFVVMSAALGLG